MLKWVRIRIVLPTHIPAGEIILYTHPIWHGDMKFHTQSIPFCWHTNPLQQTKDERQIFGGFHFMTFLIWILHIHSFFHLLPLCMSVFFLLLIHRVISCQEDFQLLHFILWGVFYCYLLSKVHFLQNAADYVRWHTKKRHAEREREYMQNNIKKAHSRDSTHTHTHTHRF